MPRKTTDRERLLAHAMSATKEQLEEAVEVYRTALRARFKPAATTSAKPRASRKKVEAGATTKSDGDIADNTNTTQ